MRPPASRDRRDAAARLVPRALLLWIGSLLGIYTLTLADQRWHMDTSLWRLLVAVLPLAVWGALPTRRDVSVPGSGSLS